MKLSYNTNSVFERAHLHGWHPKLIKVIQWLPTVMDTIVVTSSWRPNKIHSGDSGVHTTIPLRALDLRSRNYADPHRITKEINEFWAYDLDRTRLNVCLYHDTGLGHHFHIQVHDNTTIRT